MAKTPPRPVLPPPPSVGPDTPIAKAPKVGDDTPVEPVPDAWFTDFEAEEVPPSMIDTETVDVRDVEASNDAGDAAALLASSPVTEPAAAPEVAIVEAAPAEIVSAAPPLLGEAGGTVAAMPAPTPEPKQRLMTQLVAGGLAVVAVVAIAIRCSGGPASSVATPSDPIARAGGSPGVEARVEDSGSAIARNGARGDAAQGGGAAQGDAAQGGDAAKDGDAAHGGDAAQDGEAAQQGDAAENDDGAAQDGAAQDGAAQDGAAQDGAAQDGAAQDGAGQDQAARADDAAQADAAKDAAQADDARVDDAADARNDTPTTAKDGSTSAPASKSSGRTDSAASASTRSAEQSMTAEELLELARKAWKAGNARDTYKYANKSRYKQPSAEATELATLAACKMKLDEAAKSSFKELSGDRRKRVRNECRDLGVRVGL